MKCNFSFQHYREIIQLLKKQNYQFYFFSSPPHPKKRMVYLRHDVDYSPENALRLAQIENQDQAKATYFIRLSAPFYNIFDPHYCRIIKKIIQLKHQVGLHFEGDEQGSTNLSQKNIEKEVARQLKIIKNTFNIQNIVSFHRPPPKLLNQNFKNFISTYESRLINQTNYLSDSRGQWRKGCICQFLKSARPTENLQILTHPIWWGRKIKNPQRHLEMYLQGRWQYLNKYLANDISVYQRQQNFLSK